MQKPQTSRCFVGVYVDLTSPTEESSTEPQICVKSLLVFRSQLEIYLFKECSNRTVYEARKYNMSKGFLYKLQSA